LEVTSFCVIVHIGVVFSRAKFQWSLNHLISVSCTLHDFMCLRVYVCSYRVPRKMCITYCYCFWLKSRT